MLRDLPDDVADLVAGASRRRRYPANEVIVREDDPSDSVHVITRGHVAIMIATPLGRQLTYTILGPDESFGELSVLSDSPRTATARALDATETLALHRTDLDRLRREHPRVNDAMIRVLCAQVTRLSARLAEHLYLPVEARVRRRLLEVCHVYETATIPLSQDDLAELAGAARATVNRVLRQDEADGVVTLSRRQITVLDRAGLTRRAQVDERG